jgi:hypothetical protein
MLAQRRRRLPVRYRISWASFPALYQGQHGDHPGSRQAHRRARLPGRRRSPDLQKPAQLMCVWRKHPPGCWQVCRPSRRRRLRIYMQTRARDGTRTERSPRVTTETGTSGRQPRPRRFAPAPAGHGPARRREAGGVHAGEEPHRGLQHVQRLIRTGRDHHRAHGACVTASGRQFSSIPIIRSVF